MNYRYFLILIILFNYYLYANGQETSFLEGKWVGVQKGITSNLIFEFKQNKFYLTRIQNAIPRSSRDSLGYGYTEMNYEVKEHQHAAIKIQIFPIVHSITARQASLDATVIIKSIEKGNEKIILKFHFPDSINIQLDQVELIKVE